MELVGKKVLHKTFGEGVIESYKNGKINVDFISGQSQYPVFQFPEGFKNKYLSFVDGADKCEFESEFIEKSQSYSAQLSGIKTDLSTTTSAGCDSNNAFIINDSTVTVIPERKQRLRTLEDLKNYKVPYHVEHDFATVELVLKRALSDIKTMKCPCIKPQRPLSYGDKWNRSAYALRYFYAYIAEYINMFLDLLYLGLPVSEIKVLSIGCGAKIDIWSLQEALKIQRVERNIQYTGVDKEDWGHDGYCPSTENHVNETTIYNQFAGDFLSKEKLDYDVYLFPKSIGDIYFFDDESNDFSKIIAAFKEGQIMKDHFYIVASMIKYDDGIRNDIVPLQKLINGVENNCFKCKGCFVNETSDRYIVDPRNYVRYPEYPANILPDVEKLTGYKPILSRSRELYMICEFERVKG